MHNEVLHQLDPKSNVSKSQPHRFSKLKTPNSWVVWNTLAHPSHHGRLSHVSMGNGLLGSKMFLEKVGAYFRSSGINLYDPHETLEKIMVFFLNKYVTVAQYILRNDNSVD